MSEPFETPHVAADDWSAKLADRYRCVLAPELADWFDSGIWKTAGHGEYHEAVDPSALLHKVPEVIWPGLMSCELLPVISNTAGDWLCVRVDQNNRAGEVVQWYHGGGDWIPWGSHLAEAIVFDALIDRLPDTTRRHAEPAEDPRPSREATASDPIIRWALEHVPTPIAGLFESDVRGWQVAETLLEAGVAEIAVRCELVVANLTHATRPLLEKLIGSDPSVSRNDVAEWSFDVTRIPEHKRDELESQSSLTLDGLQDWDVASTHARRVTELNPELAWAWDIVGYGHERSGNVEGAIEAYRRASQCSAFTDQSIRLETHWASERSAKFSVARMQCLCPDDVASSRYLSLLCEPNLEMRRTRTTRFWDDEGSALRAFGDFRDAHRCFVAAAWDIGAESMSVYAGLLDKIAETAERSDQLARGELARTHRECLKDRYGE